MANDRLSSIAALRPVARTHDTPRSSQTTINERLSQLIGAECIQNRLGRHLVSKHFFAEPKPSAMGSTALRLLAPHSGPDIPDPGQWLFLDTETTGLCGGTGTYAFLVGLAWWTNGGLAVEQFFMRDHSDEPSMLLELSQHLARRSLLVTYNGKCFDWPLLETRYRMTRLAAATAPQMHLDLLYPARQLWRHSLKSLALSELERHVLAFDRGSDIPSDTIPSRYFDFLRGGPPEPLAEVFQHNRMDLLGLARLAVHISNILGEPDPVCRSGSELYGISKMLQKRGESLEANAALEQALTRGLPPGTSRIARRELARCAKRRRDFSRANSLWEQLLDDTREGLEAYEQLAIFYEHQSRNYLQAAVLTREALLKLRAAVQAGRISAHTYRSWHGRFQHRLDRLLAREADRQNRNGVEGSLGNGSRPAPSPIFDCGK